MRNFWCEINLDNVEHNINKIRETTNKKLMAVVKGNAYGLGVENMSLILDSLVDGFAVSNIEEALQVKSKKDILVLYPELGDDDIDLIKDNFIITVDNRIILDKLEATGRKYRVHIYVDTGMNRFGVKPNDLNNFINDIREKYKNIIIHGIYTHLQNTGDNSYTLKQIESFKNVIVDYIGEIENIHLLNSNGFLKYNKNADFDNWVRLGNVLYGYNAAGYGYKKVFFYKARAIRVYDLKMGETIGYGNSYKARENIKVGILDVGFIDKLGCVLESKANIFRDIAKAVYHHVKYHSGINYNGRIIRILGKPNMNFTLIDMSGIKEDAVFNIELPSVIADSSIPKKYRKGDSYVSI
ncbi:MAG: alanine racemase family protein [Clostridiales bacterium]|nr:alanine racemase family protein [Clostridiales bacterium]